MTVSMEKLRKSPCHYQDYELIIKGKTLSSLETSKRICDPP